MKTAWFCFLGLACLVSSPLRATAEGIVLDQGVFHVYQGDKALGAETFAFEKLDDSLYVYCEIVEKIPYPDGEMELKKSMRLLAREFDLGLVLYESIQYLDGVKLVRAIVPQDTALMVYREGNEGGEGNMIVSPPGRLFILDGQVFSLFDLICRNLHEKAFDKRPLQLFVLGVRDTFILATATDLGTETIRWNQKPVQARKIRIADSSSEYFAWIAPHGVMVRLEQPVSGLRVERKAQLEGPESANRPGG
jgi:hypothetical protein